jgi:hypothetical protein
MILPPITSFLSFVFYKEYKNHFTVSINSEMYLTAIVL